jgi:hypothetical protein
VNNTPAEDYQVERAIYYNNTGLASYVSDSGWSTLTQNTESYAAAKARVEDYIRGGTYGKLPCTFAVVRTEELKSPGLLDDYPGAAAAYSLRKLDKDYTGSAIRVRRASDNSEQDIGFNTDGTLDTSTLTTFCSGTDGFVKTWYDQSGNSNDATQTTTGDQPQIVSGGTVLGIDGNPAVQFDGSSDHMDMNHTDLYGQSRLDSFIHYQSSDDAFILYHDDTGGGGLYSFIPLIGSTATGLVGTYGSPDLYINGAQVNVVYGTTTRGDLHTAIVTNGVSATAGALETHLNSSTASWNAFGISPYNNIRLNGKICEMVFYNTDQSSNRTGIESNINTYYSIYTP